MHFSIERIWLNSYLQLVGENLTKVFIIHLINMHFNLLSLKIYHKLLFYYIQIQKFMPFNKGFFIPTPLELLMKQWLVMRILDMYQSSHEKLLECEHLAHSGTSQVGQVSQGPLIKANLHQSEKERTILWFIILLQSSAAATANPVKTEGKSKHHFWTLFLPFLLSAPRAWDSPRRAQPGWQGPLPCPGIVTLTAGTACKASLLLGAQGSGYRSTSIHLLYIFHSLACVTCRENALVAVNMVMYSLIWLELIVTLIIFQVGLGLK